MFGLLGVRVSGQGQGRSCQDYAVRRRRRCARLAACGLQLASTQ